MECRPVILGGIVFVSAMLPKLADFDGIDRLVVVQRARVEFWNAQCERTGEGQQHRQCAPPIHPEKCEKPQMGANGRKSKKKGASSRPTRPQLVLDSCLSIRGQQNHFAGSAYTSI